MVSKKNLTQYKNGFETRVNHMKTMLNCLMWITKRAWTKQGEEENSVELNLIFIQFQV